MSIQTRSLQPHEGGPPLLIQYDDALRVIWIAGTTPLRFSAAEYCLLRVLLDHFEMACSSKLLVAAWRGARGSASSRTVARVIERVQDKLEGLPLGIRAVVSYGYVLVRTCAAGEK